MSQTEQPPKIFNTLHVYVILPHKRKKSPLKVKKNFRFPHTFYLYLSFQFFDQSIVLPILYMVPLEVKFNPRDFQKDVAIIVSFFKCLVIVLVFKRPIIVSFSAIILFVFHSIQLSCFCFIFSIVRKIQVMAGIEPGPPEW